MSKIIALHHVQITISPESEDQARQFYGELMGLQEIPKPDALAGRGGLWFEMGAMQIHIGVEKGVERHASKAHIAYQVSDLQDMRQKLSDAGCDIKESVPIPGMDRFETRDPFGNRLEFLKLHR